MSILEAYSRLDSFATGGPDPDIETIRRDVFALLERFDAIARLVDICARCGPSVDRVPIDADVAKEPGTLSDALRSHSDTNL